MNRKVLSLLSLLLILPLTSAPALAAGASAGKEVGVTASILSSLLEMGGWIIWPTGETSDTTDGRSTIDPDGVMAPADPVSETDGRSTIDPNG